MKLDQSRKYLAPLVDSLNPPPRHVAIIMDGNGRWARRSGLPHISGHEKGAQALRSVLEAADDMGVSYLTVYGFSSENWRRPASEVAALMRLLRIYLKRELAELHKAGVRFRVIGDRSRFEADIIAMIEAAEARTRDNDRMNFTVALSYGGRSDILQGYAQSGR